MKSSIWTLAGLEPVAPTKADLFLYCKEGLIREVLCEINQTLGIQLITDGYDVWHRTRHPDGAVVDHMIDRFALAQLKQQLERLEKYLAMTLGIEEG